ncbi:MAG: cob(I)yrinic acid a,c-diamide adenosyltransferase [Pseudarcicella sp.]|nr:cob(I)yrinic acid a,c-diamide adenosyltransferase [Pseudarcicella sp.]MBP6411048.1 cob(I)yrinic acid a,c-diamide adenosyltransferase [Pseudarcicella sp.]
MKIYTKTGDKGKTSLVGGTRVSKDNIRIEAYGTIDELNSYIGLLGSLPENDARKDLLKEIQDRLFTIGSNLASETDQTKKKIPDLVQEDVELLEKTMDEMSEKLEPMRFFILPGGHPSIAHCHIARTVCRRAERVIIHLANTENEYVSDLVVQYVNRLSDLLFVLSRVIHKEINVDEISWKPRINQ